MIKTFPAIYLSYFYIKGKKEITIRRVSIDSHVSVCCRYSFEKTFEHLKRNEKTLVSIHF